MISSFIAAQLDGIENVSLKTKNAAIHHSATMHNVAGQASHQNKKRSMTHQHKNAAGHNITQHTKRQQYIAFMRNWVKAETTAGGPRGSSSVGRIGARRGRGRQLQGTLRSLNLGLVGSPTRPADATDAFPFELRHLRVRKREDLRIHVDVVVLLAFVEHGKIGCEDIPCRMEG